MTKNLSDNGFTLLEVMVAVALIAIALTTLLASQSQSVSFANSAKFETIAALLAQSKMSEIELRQEDTLAADSGDFGDDYPGYAWEVTVSDVSIGEVFDLSDYLKQIDLTVTWGVFSYHLRFFYYVGESSAGGTSIGGSSRNPNVNEFSGTKRSGIEAVSSAYQKGMTPPRI